MKLRLIGKAVPTWIPKMTELGHPVDDRAHDDAHRTSYSRRAEARIHNLVGDEEDGDTDQHP